MFKGDKDSFILRAFCFLESWQVSFYSLQTMFKFIVANCTFFGVIMMKLRIVKQSLQIDYIKSEQP